MNQRDKMKTVNHDSIIQPLLVDKYQISMCYAYWLDGKHDDNATFELFFRKNPFKGEYTIYAGLDDCLKFIENYAFSDDDIRYLKNIPDYSHIDEAFWEYFSRIDTRSVKLYALKEGTACFPNIPLMRLEGPIAILQLLETPLLTLTNYASLVTTNAARYRLAVDANLTGSNKCRLLEFGLRRAQGPNGGFSASKYSYMGGFDATSNMLAGRILNIPVCGTMGHSFIISCFGSNDISKSNLKNHKHLLNMQSGIIEDFTLACFEAEDKLISCRIFGSKHVAEKSELKAFIAFAVAFPRNFLALVDSYDVIKSGLVNFVIVALALLNFGYKPIGIRIDSGDLAYLSRYSKQKFDLIANKLELDEFTQLEIVASNDINEDTINSLNDQKHNITGMGIGTHLVTCQNQPALGCVYKLVETEGKYCMKLSLGTEKISIPSKKSVYRLFGRDGNALLDLMTMYDEEVPKVGERILCYHPFMIEKRTYITPSCVVPLLHLFWDGKVVGVSRNLEASRKERSHSLGFLTDDIKRCLNPTPYKVSVSEKLWNLLNKLKLELTPIGELC